MKSIREITWDNFGAGILVVVLGLLAWTNGRHPVWGAVICIIGALLAGNAVYVLVHLRNRHEELQ